MNHLFYEFNFWSQLFFQIIHDQRWVPTSFLILHISPAFFAQLTPFLHIPFIQCTSPYTSAICLWISAGWTFLAFKNCTTDRTAHVGGFVSIFNDCSKMGGKLWYFNAVHVPLDTKKMTITESDAGLLWVMGSYFLLVPCSHWQLELFSCACACTWIGWCFSLFFW